MPNDYAGRNRFIRNDRDELVNLIGELNNATQRAAVSVDGTAQAVYLTSGKRTIHLTNMGDNDIYFGNASVTSATGTPIFSGGTSWRFENCKVNFVVYVLTAAGTSDMRVMEF